MSANASSPGGTDISVTHTSLAVGLIGVAFNSFFVGLVVMQTAYYWWYYWKNDGLYLRSMVMLVAALTAFHMMFYTYSMWSHLILGHAGASGSLARGRLWYGLIGGKVMVNVTGIFAVHTFYLNRLWTLSQNRIFVTILGALILEVLAFGMYISIYTITQSTAASFHANIVRAEITLSASLVVTDVTMTTSLITLFLRLSTGNSDMKSERVVKRLIFYTFTTGMPTAICAVVAFITILKFPETIISPVFYDFSADLYACSFLASLNARRTLLGKLVETSNRCTSTGRSVTMPHFLRFATSGGTLASGLTTTADV